MFANTYLFTIRTSKTIPAIKPIIIHGFSIIKPITSHGMRAHTVYVKLSDSLVFPSLSVAEM